jgi:hypothetical protein
MDVSVRALPQLEQLDAEIGESVHQHVDIARVDASGPEHCLSRDAYDARSFAEFCRNTRGQVAA